MSFGLPFKAFRRYARRIPRLLLAAGLLASGYFLRDAVPTINDAFLDAYEYLTDDQQGAAFRYAQQLEDNGTFSYSERTTILQECFSSARQRDATLTALSLRPQTMRTTILTLTEDTGDMKDTTPADRTLRSLRITNKGRTAISSVFLRALHADDSEGLSAPFVSADYIATQLLAQGGSAAKNRALALFTLVRDYRFHFLAPTGPEVHDPIKVFDVYGHALCDDTAKVLMDLAIRTGLPARMRDIPGHGLAEVYYADRWHALDPDAGLVFFEHARVGYDIASVDALRNRPSIITANCGKGHDIPGYPGNAIGLLKNKYSSCDLSPTRSYWQGGGADDRQFMIGQRFLPLSLRQQGAEVFLQPHILRYGLAPGDSITVTNIPSADPYVQDGKSNNQPPYWANGQMRHIVAECGAGIQVRCPFVITDIAAPDGKDHGMTVSFDGANWIPIADKGQIRQGLTRRPTYSYSVRGVGAQGVVLVTTFQNSPFILGKYPFFRKDETMDLRPLIPLENLPPFRLEVTLDFEPTIAPRKAGSGPA